MSLVALAAAAALFGSMPKELPVLPDFGKDPTVNLTAIRWLSCVNTEGRAYMGTGFFVAKDTLATALHVGRGKCVDTATGKPALLYYQENGRDFALMKLEVNVGPYIKYSCKRFESGKDYNSYGYSSYLQSRVIFRQSKLQAQADYQRFDIEGKTYLPMRHLYGPMVFGHSGGPVVDADGYALGMNNVGGTWFGMLNTGHAYSTELADTTLCRRPK
jgi:hypothetical protein